MERYVLQKSQTQPNSWVCTTQQFSFLEDVRLDALFIARLMREMADWLRENHYKKIFP